MKDKAFIVEGLIKRAPRAVKWLVEQYSPDIYNLLLIYVRKQEDAEELCSDVLLSALDGIAGFKQESSLRTWLHRIAINKALDFLKRKKRKKRFGYVLPITEELSIPYDFRHPGIILEQKELEEALFAAIDVLPARQKTAIILVKFDGNSIRETAHIMELTEKAVESLLQRAKKNIRRELERRIPDD